MPVRSNKEKDVAWNKNPCSDRRIMIRFETDENTKIQRNKQLYLMFLPWGEYLLYHGVGSIMTEVWSFYHPWWWQMAGYTHWWDELHIFICYWELLRQSGWQNTASIRRYIRDFRWWWTAEEESDNFKQRKKKTLDFYRKNGFEALDTISCVEMWELNLNLWCKGYGNKERLQKTCKNSWFIWAKIGSVKRNERCRQLLACKFL